MGNSVRMFLKTSRLNRMRRVMENPSAKGNGKSKCSCSNAVTQASHCIMFDLFTINSFVMNATVHT